MDEPAVTKQESTEAALQESEAHLRLAVESSNTGLWDWNLVTNEVHFSAILKRQIGYEDHEIPNRFGEWRSRVHPDDLDRALNTINDFIAAPWPNYEIEFRFRHKDGSYRWILAKASLIKDADERVIRMIGSHLDITERKLAEQALRASEERYRKLFDYAPDGILIADEHNRFVDANPGMCQLLGYDLSEIQGMHATDIVANAEVAHIQPALAATRANTGYNREWQFRRKDGSTFAAEVIATTMHDGNLLGMVRDITERKHAEERVRQLNRTYAMLSDISQLIVRERDPQTILDQACRIAIDKGEFLLAWIGTRAAANDRFELAAHAGASADTLEILNRLFGSLQIGSTMTGEALNNATAVVCNDVANDPLAKEWRDEGLQRGYRSMVSLPLIVSTRCIGTLNLYAGYVDFFDSEELRLLGELSRDIAHALEMSEREQERHRLEYQLSQSQKMQAIGTLAGGIAHDFNNILSAIVGNAELASLDLPPGHQALTSTKEILRAAQRAKELVQRILAFSSPHEHILRPIQLQSVLDEAVQLLRATIPAGVDLVAYENRSLPAVRADASQIHQVILNLVTNAWHAMDGRSGRIELRLDACRVDSTLCQAQPELRPGPHVRLSVKDTGKGLEAATLERIFEPFFTTKPSGQGAGLGLSVVHGIVRSHGGAIIVDSKPAQGSTFHLYFPATTETADAVIKDPIPVQAASGRNEHILYLDDEEALVYLVVRFLERHGYRVDGYTRAAEALAAFRANPRTYDLVITDFNMPGMSGMEFAQQLLSIQPDALVALASGYVRPAEIEQARTLGVREIILKPNTVEEMIPVVQRLLATRMTMPAKPVDPSVVRN
jgi:PAS domain S-box-containing protein